VTPAGLYIHIPFCTSVCPYCDFAVLIAGDERRDAYVRGIEAEAQLYADCGLNFDTVYIGGGTPSSLQAGQLGEVVDAVRSHLTITPEAELFLEVNPDDVTRESISQWCDLGVTTVSIGVQSFDDQVLRFLGRGHDAATARKALELVQSARFDTVSIDLIYAFQGQTAEDWRGQLDQAVALSVDHLSCYQLTLHQGTVFGRRRERGLIEELPDDVQAELFSLTHLHLTGAGFHGYEVSNFAATSDNQSRHNLKYWNHTPYLGLGPSAHSFMDDRRRWNRRKLRLWQRELDRGRSPIEGGESLSPDQLAAEAVMLGLRTAAGLDLDRLKARHGVDLIPSNESAIDRFIASGHLSLEGEHLRPTVEGMLIADTLARSLDVSTHPRPAPYED
jgi:oxygen-independent coproporphyrinogen-3 oxidase